MKNFTKLLALAIAFVGAGVGTAQAQILVTTADGLSDGDIIYITGAITSTDNSVSRDYSKVFTIGYGKDGDGNKVASTNAGNDEKPSAANLFTVETVTETTNGFKLKNVESNSYIPKANAKQYWADNNGSTIIGSLVSSSDDAATFTIVPATSNNYSNVVRLKTTVTTTGSGEQATYLRVSAQAAPGPLYADYHNGTGDRTLVRVYKCISGVENPFSTEGFSWTLKDGGSNKYYSTLYLPFDVTVSGATAYTASVSGSNVTATSYTETVYGNNGVLLVGTSDKATITYAGVTNSTISGNAFAGTNLATATAPANCYVFSKGTDGVGFFSLASGSTLAANRAYITASLSSGVNALSLDLDGEATGINAVESETNTAAPIYDLSGRRVVKAAKGLYIQGGKKVYLK